MGTKKTKKPSSRSRNKQIDGKGILRVDLGSLDAIPPGFDLGVDIFPGANPKIMQADLRKPWPFKDSSIAYFRAHDVVEHLPDKLHTMNELWRCLKAGGQAEIAVPTTGGPGAFQDPMHVSYWNSRSFLYYEEGSPTRNRLAAPYGILARFKTKWSELKETPDGPRFTVILEAVK